MEPEASLDHQEPRVDPHLREALTEEGCQPFDCVKSKESSELGG